MDVLIHNSTDAKQENSRRLLSWSAKCVLQILSCKYPPDSKQQGKQCWLREDSLRKEIKENGIHLSGDKRGGGNSSKGCTVADAHGVFGELPVILFVMTSCETWSVQCSLDPKWKISLSLASSARTQLQVLEAQINSGSNEGLLSLHTLSPSYSGWNEQFSTFDDMRVLCIKWQILIFSYASIWTIAWYFSPQSITELQGQRWDPTVLCCQVVNSHMNYLAVHYRSRICVR